MNKMVQMEVGVVTYLLGIKIGPSHVTSDPVLPALISEEGSCSHITTPQSSGSPSGGADDYKKPEASAAA